MALVYNATNEDQSIKIYGNWFNLKSGAIKSIDDKLAHGIATDKKEYGCVVLPETMEDLEFRATDEGKKILEEKKAEGLQNYLSHLRGIVANNQISLRQDLERANIKADPAVFASLGEEKAMETLARYQRGKEDEAQIRAERLKELVKQSGFGKK